MLHVVFVLPGNLPTRGDATESTQVKGRGGDAGIVHSLLEFETQVGLFPKVPSWMKHPYVEWFEPHADQGLCPAHCQTRQPGVAEHAPRQSLSPMRPSCDHASCVQLMPDTFFVNDGSNDAVVSAGLAVAGSPSLNCHP